MPDSSFVFHQEFSQAKQHVDWFYEALWLYGPKLFKALLTLAFFYLLYRMLSPLLEKMLFGKQNTDEGVRQLVQKALKGFMFVIGLITALGQFMNIGPLLGSLGLLGIAVGLAAQDTFQNLIAGVTILIDKPFKVGDNVMVGDSFGTVTEITLRSTRIQTPNHEVAILPNVQMINQKVINHTFLPQIRLEIPFSIAYHESPDLARQVVLDLVQADERISKDPAPSVSLIRMAESSINFKLRFWTKIPKDEFPISEFYNEAVLNALKANDIEIPFNQVTIHLPEQLPRLGLAG